MRRKTRNKTRYFLCGPGFKETDEGGLFGFNDFTDQETGKCRWFVEKEFRTLRKLNGFLDRMDEIAEKGEVVRYRKYRSTPSRRFEWSGAFVWGGWKNGARVVAQIGVSEEPETFRIPRRHERLF